MAAADCSLKMLKREEESGQPCLVPRCGENLCDVSPLVMTVAEGDVYNILIIFLNNSPIIIIIIISITDTVINNNTNNNNLKKNYWQNKRTKRAGSQTLLIF